MAATTSATGRTQRTPISSPSPRTSATTPGWASTTRRQPLLQVEPHDGATFSRNSALLTISTHRLADRHGQRVAAEGRAVGARRHALGGLRRREARADRKAAAEALGGGHDVGRRARPFIREELAGAADAGLHLVEDEQQAVLVGTARADRAGTRPSTAADAALALDRLDQDRGGLRADRCLHRLDVPERHLVEARRPAARSLPGISGCRWRRGSPACARERRRRT